MDGEEQGVNIMNNQQVITSFIKFSVPGQTVTHISRIEVSELRPKIPTTVKDVGGGPVNPLHNSELHT